MNLSEDGTITLPFGFYNSVEADSLTMQILIKITKKGNSFQDVKTFINRLPDYQRLSIAQWITSHVPEDNFWYQQVYGLVLESLVHEYMMKAPENKIKIFKQARPKNKFDYQRAKQDLKCEELAEKYGVALKQTGSNLMTGICPFHEDTDPSFTIYLNSNSFYCFGCHIGGDSIALLKNFTNK